MKKFYLSFVVSFLALAGSVTAVSGFSGCTTLREHSATVNLVISQAVLRYIDDARPLDRAQRAARVLKVVSDIEAVTNNDELTVTQLAAVAVAHIPDNMSPADRQLALAIVNIASQELRNRVGEGLLKPDQLTSVREMLDAIKQAARIYLPEAST